MTPQEEALLQRLEGKRREELRQAFEVLARIRREHPGIDDPQQLPPEARAEALRALSAMRRVVDGGGSAVTTIVSWVLLLVAVGVLWLKPVAAYHCVPQGEGLAQCVVSARILGLVPLHSRRIQGIAGASADAHTEYSESTDSKGRKQDVSTRVEVLLFKAADGSELLRVSESHLLGASLADVAGGVEALASGDRSAPFVRWNAVWPVLLLATPFALIAVSQLFALLGQGLANHGLISPMLYRIAFYWAPSFGVLALFACTWAIVYLGGDPPSWLLQGLGLS